MPDTHLTLTVPSNPELCDPDYLAELKAFVRAQPLSQRDWHDAIAEMFLRAYLRGVQFQYAPVPYDIPEIDELWPERYIRRFLEDPDCSHPERVRPIAIYRDYRLRRFTS